MGLVCDVFAVTFYAVPFATFIRLVVVLTSTEDSSSCLVI